MYPTSQTTIKALHSQMLLVPSFLQFDSVTRIVCLVVTMSDWMTHSEQPGPTDTPSVHARQGHTGRSDLHEDSDINVYADGRLHIAQSTLRYPRRRLQHTAQD
jgi:hypothetical protein